jgi:hypothetical protein
MDTTTYKTRSFSFIWFCSLPTTLSIAMPSVKLFGVTHGLGIDDLNDVKSSKYLSCLTSPICSDPSFVRILHSFVPSFDTVLLSTLLSFGDIHLKNLNWGTSHSLHLPEAKPRGNALSIQPQERATKNEILNHKSEIVCKGTMMTIGIVFKDVSRLWLATMQRQVDSSPTFW